MESRDRVINTEEHIYTKKDFDNMIQKKERLILERNAELFPEGKCKVALELFDKYESIRSTKGKNSHSRNFVTVNQPRS